MAVNIKEVQRKLNGWWEVTPKLKEDGLWGANTQRGVRQFQKRVGLPQSGQLDAATLQRLGVVATSGNGNPSTGFFEWSKQARKASDELGQYIDSLNPFSPRYAPLKKQAEALKRAAQGAEVRAQQRERASTPPDPALTAQIAQLQAAVSQLTGSAGAQPPDNSGGGIPTWLLYGGAALAVIFVIGRD